jgi:hypothetical protein
MQLYRAKYIKYLRTRKYGWEHKFEWNLSLVWLFLATVTCYLNCLDTTVLAHPFSALATFPVCFSVLSHWTNTSPSTPSSWIWKNIPYVKKTIYVPNDDYFMSVGLQWTKRKIGNIVTLYRRELFKNIPRLATFCTHSVHEGLNAHKSSCKVPFLLLLLLLRARQLMPQKHRSLRLIVQP